MKEVAEALARLARSSFRSSVELKGKELRYLRRKGLPTVLEHAADFVAKRLSAAEPANDGKQTPWQGHPAFVAQHATGTCCRGCLWKWHGIERGRELLVEERRYIVEVMGTWLARYTEQTEGEKEAAAGGGGA